MSATAPRPDEGADAPGSSPLPDPSRRPRLRVARASFDGRSMSCFSPEVAAGLIRSVKAGATIDEAARRLGVPVNTARGWLRDGRRDPAGKYGSLALLVDGHRRDRQETEKAAAKADGPLTVAEAEMLLSRAAREGSVAAVRTWLERFAGPQPASETDPFSQFDELAAKRSRRVA